MHLSTFILYLTRNFNPGLKRRLIKIKSADRKIFRKILNENIRGKSSQTYYMAGGVAGQSVSGGLVHPFGQQLSPGVQAVMGVPSH